MVEWRNPRYNAVGTIDIDLKHPVHGWIPFTASPDDVEEYGRDLYAAVLAEGNASPYVSPPQLPDPIPPIISRRQFYQGLEASGKISKAEALAAIKGVALPGALQIIVDEMTDDDAAFEAEMLLLGASEFEREHPLTLMIGMSQNLSETEIDEFWRLCAAL